MVALEDRERKINVLKSQGYQLKYNFGHDKEHLASLLLTMNLLAFGLHALLDLTDESYRLIRSAVGARQKFSTPGGADNLSVFRNPGTADEFHDAGSGN